MILHIIGRSTAISEGLKNVGDQVYFELRRNFQFWNFSMLTVELIFGKLLKLDQILWRNISQIFWVFVELQQEFSKNSCQKHQKQANKRQKQASKAPKMDFYS